MTELKKANRRVCWVPSKVQTWARGDEWNNEFTSATGTKLTDEQMEVYTEWSEKISMGTIVDNMLDDIDEFVFIVLDVKEVGLPSMVVSYPKDVFTQDPAFEISILSSAEQQAFNVADETNRRC